mgnify:CR=1 FL=1
MIAPGCLLRPHLTPRLIKYPIGALIAGGVEDPDAILEFGAALLQKERPYVELTPEGRYWLENHWPGLGDTVRDVVAQVIAELDSDGV